MDLSTKRANPAQSPPVAPVAGARPGFEICPECQTPIKAKKLASHRQERCPKRPDRPAPTAPAANLLAAGPAPVPAPSVVKVLKEIVRCPFCHKQFTPQNITTHITPCLQRQGRPVPSLASLVYALPQLPSRPVSPPAGAKPPATRKFTEPITPLPPDKKECKVCRQPIKATKLDEHMRRVHPNHNPATGLLILPAGYLSWEAFFKELHRLPETQSRFCPRCRFCSPPTKLIKHLRQEHDIAPSTPTPAPTAKKASSGSPTTRRNPKGQGLHFVSLDQLLARENEDVTRG